jgi:hypothetical protein
MDSELGEFVVKGFAVLRDRLKAVEGAVTGLIAYV